MIGLLDRGTLFGVLVHQPRHGGDEIGFKVFYVLKTHGNAQDAWIHTWGREDSLFNKGFHTT